MYSALQFQKCCKNEAYLMRPIYCLFNTRRASSSSELLIIIIDYEDKPFSYWLTEEHLEPAVIKMDLLCFSYLVTYRANSFPKSQAGRSHHFWSPGWAGHSLYICSFR